MIPKPHHQQFYTKAEWQRYRCPSRMLQVLEIVNKIIKGRVCFASHHYFYRKLLEYL
jgi:hypothetical protein